MQINSLLMFIVEVCECIYTKPGYLRLVTNIVKKQYFIANGVAVKYCSTLFTTYNSPMI